MQSGSPDAATGPPARVGPSDIVVIGAQKAASTLLAAALREHPEVEFAPGEFHGFLDQNYGPSTAGTLAGLFHDPTATRRGFKCASYLGTPSVAPRLMADLNDPDVLVALRDPVRRAVSAWYWYMRVGLVPVLPHDVALRKILDAQRGHQSAPWRHGPEILQWGLYAHLLQQWWEVFPRHRTQVVVDHDLRDRPVETITGLYGALGLDPSHQPTAHLQPQNDGIYSLPRIRWLRVRHRWTWQQNAEGIWFSGRPRQRWAAAANAVVVGTDRLVLSRLLSPALPPLDPALEADLRAYYRRDVLTLQELLDTDLAHWLKLP